MHSFQPSRGRVLFEFVCALGIVASCVGAWKQTGASALLLAAFAAGLYGFVHLFDMRWPKSAEAIDPQRVEFEPPQVEFEPQRIEFEPQRVELEPQRVEFEPQRVEFEPAVQRDPPPYQDARVLQAAIDEQFSTEEQVELQSSAEQVEPVEPAAPKSGEGRRAKAPRKATGRRASASKKAKVEEIALPEETDVTELPPLEEEHHSPLAPLFEPEPFTRMQRPAFGRKAGFGRRAG